MRDPNRVGSVDRALVLLQLLNRRSVVRVGEAAAELGVAPSTAHRLLATLCDRGFAVEDEHRRYRAGPELLGVSGDRSTVPDVVRALRPSLEALFRRVGETVHLMVLAGSDVRFVDGIESEQGLRVGLRTGARMPAYCVSAGKAMLAELSWQEVEVLYRLGLPRWPQAKIQSLAALRTELTAVRKRGYARNVEESEPGVTAIGICLSAPQGVPAAGLSVAVPTARFTRANEDLVVQALSVARRAGEKALRELSSP